MSVLVVMSQHVHVLYFIECQFECYFVILGSTWWLVVIFLDNGTIIMMINITVAEAAAP